MGRLGVEGICQGLGFIRSGNVLMKQYAAVHFRLQAY
jgi:hypothetical protein